MKSLGWFVTDTAEIAVTPITETIFESMIDTKVIKSASRNEGKPIFRISLFMLLSYCFSSEVFAVIFPLHPVFFLLYHNKTGNCQKKIGVWI